MLCYKNGALAREQVRDQYADGHWTRFNELVEQRPVGNGGYMGFYFPLPEIIPPNVQGSFFFKVPQSDVCGSASEISTVAEPEFPVPAHPRAILESQFLSIRSRIAAILPKQSVMVGVQDTILITAVHQISYPFITNIWLHLLLKIGHATFQTTYKCGQVNESRDF